MLNDIEDLNISEVVSDSEMVPAMGPTHWANHIIFIIKFAKFIDSGCALEFIMIINNDKKMLVTADQM